MFALFGCKQLDRKGRGDILYPPVSGIIPRQRFDDALFEPYCCRADLFAAQLFRPEFRILQDRKIKRWRLK